MHAPLRFRFGHALHAVHAALVFEFGIDALSRYGKHDFFHAAQFRIAHVDDIQFPAHALRIVLVHAEQFRREQIRLFAACAAADLHDHVALVVFIFGQ